MDIDIDKVKLGKYMHMIQAGEDRTERNLHIFVTAIM
jgi:hypothetical protein